MPECFRRLVLCSTKRIPNRLARHGHRAFPLLRDIVAVALTLECLPSFLRGHRSYRGIFEHRQCITGQRSIASTTAISAVFRSHSSSYSGREFLTNARDSAAASLSDTPHVIDMDVTRHNFESVLPSILSALKSCDFVALDGEFTGLYPSPDVPFG